MKKTICLFIAVIITLSALTCSMASFVSAAGTMKISASAAEGRPGSTALVNINISDNPGFWSVRFLICYNSSVLSISSKNSIMIGGVIQPSEYYTSNPDSRPSANADASKAIAAAGLSADETFYMSVVVESQSLSDNNFNNGTLMSIVFNVSSAAPEGSYPITIVPIDTDDFIKLDFSSPSYCTTIPCTFEAGSVKTASGAADPVLPDTETEPAYETVIGDDGKLVTDAEGGFATRPVTDAAGEQVYNKVIKDTEGLYTSPYEPVATADPNATKAPVTEIVTDAEGNTSVVDASQTGDKGNTSDDGEKDKNGFDWKMIAIIAAAAVLLAGLIVAFVFVFKNNEKKTGGKDK